jgi:hypothetical protein
MNRRTLFKGVAALLGGAAAAKVGVPAAKPTPKQWMRKMVMRHKTWRGPAGGCLVPQDHPIFDIAEVTDQHGNTVQVPRLRHNSKEAT